MTLLLVDGFDHYTTNAQAAAKGWTVNGFNGMIAGRFGGQAINTGNGWTRPFPVAVAAGIVGCAFKAGSLGNTILAVLDSGTAQLDIRLTGTGALQVTRNGTVLATSNAAVVQAGIWCYLELKFLIDPAVGTYAVRLNGGAVPGLPDASGQNTRATGLSSANQMAVGQSSGGNISADDTYYCDTAGAVNNSFLGDVRVSTLYPTAPGNYTNWATLVGAATHWQAVNEVTPNDDTSYVADLTPGTLDSYAFGDLPTTAGTVKGVAVNPYARKDDAGVRSVASIARLAATDKIGATQTLAGSYQFFPEIMETDPSGAAWSIANVNAAEFGVKEVA